MLHRLPLLPLSTAYLIHLLVQLLFQCWDVLPRDFRCSSSFCILLGFMGPCLDRLILVRSTRRNLYKCGINLNIFKTPFNKYVANIITVHHCNTPKCYLKEQFRPLSTVIISWMADRVNGSLSLFFRVKFWSITMMNCYNIVT